MSNVGRMEPRMHASPPDTINGGFTLDDFGYNPELETPEAKMPDFANPNPEPAILAEYEELFELNEGYFERSLYVDALCGRNVNLGRPEQDERAWLLRAAKRHMLGVPMPKKQDTYALIKKAYLEAGRG